MKVLVAPTAFKGTLSPAQVARAIAKGINDAARDKGADVEILLLPLADGGDGTIESVSMAAGGIEYEEQVLGPTSKPVAARWLQLEDEAVVELACACGIATIADSLDPMGAHTFGLGQMMARCHERGLRKLNIAVGGSASTDGGMGALRALGVHFFDASGMEMQTLGGQCLAAIRDCDFMDARWFTRDTSVKILTDVANPLLGPNGAAHIFAPQKGADNAQVELLEQGLKNYADVLERASGAALRDLPGAGAAGGTAFGLASVLNAEIVSGFDWVAEHTQLEPKIRECDFVISGEGRFDSQSLGGKVLGRLLQACRQANKPLWIVAGSAEELGSSQMAEKVVVPGRGAADTCSESDIEFAIADAFLFHNFSTTGA